MKKCCFILLKKNFSNLEKRYYHQEHKGPAISNSCSCTVCHLLMDFVWNCDRQASASGNNIDYPLGKPFESTHTHAHVGKKQSKIFIEIFQGLWHYSESIPVGGIILTQYSTV